MSKSSLLSAYLIAVVALSSGVRATEFFVSKTGDDANPGSARETALASIQKGVDLLQPGDTLTVAPGEYFESIARKDLGSAEKETTIRAELPGTVVLRGDVAAPVFKPLPGHRYVYVADFAFVGEVPVVNEIDTLSILKRMPDSAELEFIPGTFFHDVKAGKLYVATSDFKPAEAHHYSVSVRPTHGIYLTRPQRVTIDGLSATGFSAMGVLNYRAATGGGVWGIFLANGKRSVIRNCRAWLNAWGIGSNSGDITSGDNAIERCIAWGNKSVFADGDMGGITLFGARRDVIRDSTAFLNGMYGVNIYGTGGAPPGADDGGNTPENRSMLINNLAWGNETADIKIKTGYEYFHVAENCVGLGKWSTTNVTNGLMGNGHDPTNSPNNIDLKSEVGLDWQREFADSDHRDFRLQATSRLRGAGADGKDRGPFPYAANIFYVKTDGDDQADGLSIAGAWKTLRRATGHLRAGDTIYLESGVYAGGLELPPGESIHLRGRGHGSVIIQGAVRVAGGRSVQFERLSFRDAVKVEQSQGVSFSQCDFSAAGTSMEAAGVRGLTVSHCTFTGFQQAALALQDCSQVDLSGNIYDNAQAPALRLAQSEMVRDANYNSYRRADAAWEVGGQTRPWAEVQKAHEQQSRELAPEWAVADGAVTLKNPALFAAGGRYGKPLGRYEDEPRRSVLSIVAQPVVHSVSATTANLEWFTSLPATCHLAWGETAACERAVDFNVNCFGTYSLTGLQPGRRYYFKIKSIEIPKDMLPKTEAQAVELTDEPLAFTTLEKNAAPAVYYVAPDGDDTQPGLDRAHAWRTIRYAATKVNVGDTVLIAGGKYFERVRLRATGDEGAPISFRAVPGEHVALEGNGMLLNNAFIVGGKSHLRFDGFYFANFNLFPNDSWSLLNSGELQLYQGKDIEITRCFSDGRGGYSAAPVSAYNIENLRMRNCVNTNKFGGMYFWRCPDLVIENTVFAAPMIMSFVLRNEKTQMATMSNCIFTDMFEKKAKLNIGLLCCDGAPDAFRHRNNDYLLRCFPPEERALNGDKPIGQLGDIISDALFVDPQFAGDPGLKGHPEDKSGYAPDRLMDPALKLDFDSFFATHPELIKRGIGLQREAFADFHFGKPAAPLP